MTDLPDRPSPLVTAYQWAWKIIGLAVSMVVPGLLGYWLDQRLGTVALFTLLGFAGGMGLGMWRLLQIAKSGDSDSGPSA